MDECPKCGGNYLQSKPIKSDSNIKYIGLVCLTCGTKVKTITRDLVNRSGKK